jgi:hypothetical protein
VWDSHITHPTRISATWAELGPALQAFQITTPPDSAKAATRGLQTCLRDTHRQDWMLKEWHQNN